MEYCCHLLIGAPSYSLDKLDKLQKQVCATVCPSLAASLDPLGHRQNLATLILSYRYYFGRFSSQKAELVQLPHCSKRLHSLF